MQSVIDVRDMHTAIHSLYLVKRKPKTTDKLFRLLQAGQAPEDVESQIDANTEYLGEVDYHNFKGQKVWHNHQLISDVTYEYRDLKYKVIGSYDL